MPLSLQQILTAMAVARLPQDDEDNDEDFSDNKTTNLQAVQQANDTSPFHDALHEYTLFARPKTTDDVRDLTSLVLRLIQIMDTSPDAWKIFALTACLRRYHDKAPEARLVAKQKEPEDRSVGDGERLVYYVTIQTMHRFWQENQDGASKSAELAKKAAATLIRVGARIGGTRDLCTMIEHLSMMQLLHVGMMEEENPPAKFANKLVPVIQKIALNNNDDELLELAIQLAADHLEHDLHLIQQDDQANDGEDILSTVHVFIPHNQRGSNSKSGWKRKLANSLSEVLIWQKTRAATNDTRFARAMEKLKALPEDVKVIDQAHSLIQQMQTTIRKKRQLLNNYSRQQGFLVTSSYQMDKTTLTLRMIRRAKAGDLKLLEKLAKKHRDARVLKLIAKRHLDPAKATPIAEIADLSASWMDIHKDYGDDEIAKLELTLQTNTLQATMDKLRNGNKNNDRPALVTCIGSDRDNVTCAILVAASLEGSRLILAGEEHDVSTTEKSMEMLNSVLINGKFVTGAESLMSVEDVFSNHSWMGTSQDVIVLSARDVELDENVLKDLQNRDITVRVHATKKVQAETGQVQLSLNSTVYNRIKSKEPLTLGVMLDCTGSMGGEIEGCKKGALQLISTFQELAPVKAVNFLGYWDPVNVRSDPPPKSTGYLDANKPENTTELQTFVNTKLRCQGGGDEPEDIPQALEKFVEDMKAAGLSADQGVHLVFFIADAGYRPNENQRVAAALESLKKLGVVMVLCQVRDGRYGGTLQAFATRTAECFQGDGQYIELSGVGQLASIAASVTESIRASLFQSGNVQSITASVGSTIDTLGKLVNFQEDHETLRKTKDLVKLEEDEEEGDMDVDDEPKVFAEKKEYALTSRDRLYLQLSRLPDLCHQSVTAAFGGKTLQELSAATIAERLCAEKIPVAEVQKAGYPKDIVVLVQNLMAGHGVKRES